MILDNLDPKEWLQLNAQLQQKKNALRADLNQRGILQKDKVNNFDNYKYFSEAGYKKLFTELFSTISSIKAGVAVHSTSLSSSIIILML